VHGRTRAQGYTGQADWEAIGKVKRALKIPVIGNGDVNSGEDARRLMEVSGCDGVMIGRGALGNPWLYKSIEAFLAGAETPPVPGALELKDAALKHLELELSTEPERIAVLKFRRIACWYFKNMPGAAEFRKRINTTETADLMRQAIQEFGS